MTDAIKKLIEDNRWRDISEAPDKTTRMIATDRRVIEVIEYGNDPKWCSHGCYEPTHFRPLPDDRCAMALKVAIEALRAVGCGSNASAKTARETDKIVTQKALQEITKIAEGKSDANER